MAARRGEQPNPGLDRAASVDAVVHFKGIRQANKIALALRAKAMNGRAVNGGLNAALAAHLYDDVSSVHEAAVKKVMVDDLTRKVNVLSGKIKRMKLDMRQQFASAHAHAHGGGGGGGGGGSGGGGVDNKNQSDSEASTPGGEVDGKRSKKLRHHQHQHHQPGGSDGNHPENEDEDEEDEEDDPTKDSVGYERMLRNQSKPRGKRGGGGGGKAGRKDVKTAQGDRAKALMRSLDRRANGLAAAAAAAAAGGHGAGAGAGTGATGAGTSGGTVASSGGGNGGSAVAGRNSSSSGSSSNNNSKGLPIKGQGQRGAQRAKSNSQAAQAALEAYDGPLQALQRLAGRQASGRHVGREEFLKDGTPPFNLPSETLLQLVTMELRFKDDAEREALQEHLQGEANQDLFECTFWYVEKL